MATVASQSITSIVRIWRPGVYRSHWDLQRTCRATCFVLAAPLLLELMFAGVPVAFASVP